MISSGSINGHTFGSLTINGGQFRQELEASSTRIDSGMSARATLRAVPRGTARQEIQPTASATRRRPARGTAASKFSMDGGMSVRSSAECVMVISTGAMLAPIRRLSAASDFEMSVLATCVAGWRYIRPTEWKRISFVMDRRSLLTLAERRHVLITDRSRTIRVPPEKDL
jgi:hypothetical protein